MYVQCIKAKFKWTNNQTDATESPLNNNNNKKSKMICTNKPNL